MNERYYRVRLQRIVTPLVNLSHAIALNLSRWGNVGVIENKGQKDYWFGTEDRGIFRRTCLAGS